MASLRAEAALEAFFGVPQRFKGSLTASSEVLSALKSLNLRLPSSREEVAALDPQFQRILQDFSLSNASTAEGHGQPSPPPPPPSRRYLSFEEFTALVDALRVLPGNEFDPPPLKATPPKKPAASPVQPRRALEPATAPRTSTFRQAGSAVVAVPPSTRSSPPKGFVGKRRTAEHWSFANTRRSFSRLRSPSPIDVGGGERKDNGEGETTVFLHHAEARSPLREGIAFPPTANGSDRNSATDSVNEGSFSSAHAGTDTSDTSSQPGDADLDLHITPRLSQRNLLEQQPPLSTRSLNVSSSPDVRAFSLLLAGTTIDLSY